MTKFWAHRGASGHAPENTMPAFERAIELGADGVELDVQRSADGHLVVIHDETIDRTSDGSGRVVALTLGQLRQYHYGDHEVSAQLPTLAEVFELLRGTGVTINVELKTSIELYPGIEAQALGLAQSMGVAEQVVWSSFNHSTLLGLRGQVGREQLGLLFADGFVAPWRYAHELGAGALHPGLHLLQQPEFVTRAHEAGLRVHVWTVNEPEHIVAALSLGVDAIITNYPERRALASR